MRIVYPYNELLPKNKAHDVFIVQECFALAENQCSVTLLFGKGKQNGSLLEHYQLPPNPHFELRPLPLIRKNNWLRLSWNRPFFAACQKYIAKQRPDWVVMSVRKQGAYHLERKIPGVRYLYEVHELLHYNGTPQPKVAREKQMLEQADLITVTTSALKEILLRPPYSIHTPIEVSPLAVKAAPLPAPLPSSPLILAYVGQLYQGQGLPLLLEALSQTKQVRLKVIGGKPAEIQDYRALCEKLGIAKRVDWVGFVPPSQISRHLTDVQAFVAPFEASGRMPYVAHTKLLEYARWGRPLIAPDLPIVRDHFDHNHGALLFEVGNAHSLATSIEALQSEKTLMRLQEQISHFANAFSWEERAKHYVSLFRS